MTGPDVPEKDRLAEAVIWGLREGAGASDSATAIVEPVSRDMPVGNLSHEDLQAVASDLKGPASFDHLVGNQQKIARSRPLPHLAPTSREGWVRKPSGLRLPHVP